MTEEVIPIRDFIPVEADYGTIWPPIELPKTPRAVHSEIKTPNSRHPGPRAGASNNGRDISGGSPPLGVPDNSCEPLPWPSTRIFDPQDQIFATQPSSKSGMTKRKGVGEVNVDHGFQTVEFAAPCDLKANTECGMREIEGASAKDVTTANGVEDRAETKALPNPGARHKDAAFNPHPASRAPP